MPFLNPKLGINFSDYITDRTINFNGREWVFEAIQNWLADPKGDRFFLITGEPGSGKTAIAARLAQFTQGAETNQRFEAGFLQAVHFCSARDSVWIDPKEFARSLALQLAASIPEFGLALKDIGENTTNINVDLTVGTAQNSDIKGVVIQNLTISGLTGQEAFTQMVVNPLRQIQKERVSQPIVILVDSLDEALTHNGETQIVDLLSKLSSCVQVRFILTSRQEVKVENAFWKGVNELCLSAQKFRRNNRQDIQVYIEKRLAEEKSLADHISNLYPTQQTDQIAEIVDKSDGNFQYVSFLLNSISYGKRSLDGLPEGLDRLYLESLNQVIPLDRNNWLTVYAPVLGVLSAAQVSLTQNQIQAFTNNSLHEEVLWKCLIDLKQFLHETEFNSEHEENDSQYQVYHQSMTDFLQLKLIGKKKQKNPYYIPAHYGDRLITEYYWNRYSPGWNKCDLYGFKHLAAHLNKLADIENQSTQIEIYHERLNELLMSFNWLQSKLNAGLAISDLISDYKYLSNDTEFCLIHDALCLSSSFIENDPSQLASQLVGRLHIYKSPDNEKIYKLLNAIEEISSFKWLCPLNPNLQIPGYYLKKILRRDANIVHAVVITSNEKILISATEILVSEGLREHRLEIWNLETSMLLYTKEAHDERITALVISHDGRKVISGSLDETVKLWDLLETENDQFQLQEVYQFKSQDENNQGISSIVVTPNNNSIIVGSYDGNIKSWSLEDYNKFHIFPKYAKKRHGFAVISLTIAISQTQLISIERDKTIKLWDLAKYELLKSPLQAHIDLVNSAQAISLDKHIIAVFDDGYVEVWNLQTDPPKKYEQKIHDFPIHSIEIIDDDLVALGFDNGLVEICKFESGEIELPLKCLVSLKHHSDAINMLLKTPQKKNLIAASSDGTISICELDNNNDALTLKKLNQFEGHTRP
jgi:WD40 repeat protein